MRFLLVNPYYPISEGPSPPLGIACLAGALEAHGIEVRVLDFVVFPYSKNYLNQAMTDFQPDCIGVTCVTMNFYNAIQVIVDAKTIDKDVCTVMGGPHVSFCAEETLLNYPELDCIVVGEGEESIISLAGEVENEKKFENVENLVYRDGDTIRKTPVKAYAIDVNTLPFPARHLIPLGRYRALNVAVNMITSRGCPFRCIFCVGRKMVGKKVRYKTPERVVDELEMISKYGFSQINIADDLFTANKTHCKDICDRILERGLDIRWSSFARVDTVSLEVLKKMKQAGCTAVSYGIESANETILKTVKKGITIDQVKKAVDMCNEAEILPCASFILGLPGETPETIEESINFAKEFLYPNGVHFGFHILAPFPGTEVREEIEKYDIRILTDDWSQYHANRAVVETKKVTRKMLDDFAEAWDRGCDEKLKNIENLLDAGKIKKEEAFDLTWLRRTIISHELMMHRTVETHGLYQNGTGPVDKEEAVCSFVDTIFPFQEHKKTDLADLISHLHTNGILHYEAKDGMIRWKWQDYL